MLKRRIESARVTCKRSQLNFMRAERTVQERTRVGAISREQRQNLYSLRDA